MSIKGILLAADGDLQIQGGKLLIGHTTMQEVSVILQMVQGEQRFMPTLGANLIQLVRSKSSRFDLENRVKVHLALDNKSYEQIKEHIQTTLEK